MIARTVDARGKTRPTQIAELARMIDGADQVTVYADDLSFAKDIYAWCKETHHKLVSVDARGVEKKIRRPRSMAWKCTRYMA